MRRLGGQHTQPSLQGEVAFVARLVLVKRLAKGFDVLGGGRAGPASTSLQVS